MQAGNRLRMCTYITSSVLLKAQSLRYILRAVWDYKKDKDTKKRLWIYYDIHLRPSFPKLPLHFYHLPCIIWAVYDTHEVSKRFVKKKLSGTNPKAAMGATLTKSMGTIGEHIFHLLKQLKRFFSIAHRGLIHRMDSLNLIHNIAHRLCWKIVLGSSELILKWDLFLIYLFF